MVWRRLRPNEEGGVAVPTSGGASRRGYAAALVGGLLSAAAVTVGVAQPWFEASATPKNLPELEGAATGADLVPLVGALGVVLLASFGAVIATRGWLRRSLGLLIMAGGVVVIVAVVNPGNTDEVLRAGLAARGWPGGEYETAGQPWRWLSLLGAAGCVGAGAAVARLGAHWPTMGQRYDAPGPSGDSPAGTDDAHTESDGSVTAERLWRALDQGRDPTQRT